MISCYTGPLDYVYQLYRIAKMLYHLLLASLKHKTVAAIYWLSLVVVKTAVSKFLLRVSISSAFFLVHWNNIVHILTLFTHFVFFCLVYICIVWLAICHICFWGRNLDCLGYKGSFSLLTFF